jgi:hypothetical protein
MITRRSQVIRSELARTMTIRITCLWAGLCLFAGCEPSSPEIAAKDAAKKETANTDESSSLSQDQRLLLRARPRAQERIRPLRPPIQIVRGAAYSDGGTVMVQLRDADKRDFMLFVAADNWNLYLGGLHSGDARARLPLDMEEAKSAVASLESAMQTWLNEQATKDGLDGTKSAKEAIRERGRKNKNRTEDWNYEIAESLFNALKHRETFAFADPKQLAEQAKALESIDIEGLAKEFRKKAGQTRLDIWERIRPAFQQVVEDAEDKPTLIALVPKLFGVSDAAAFQDASGMLGDLSGNVAPSDKIFAYYVEREVDADTNFCRVLVLDFRNPARPNFPVIAVAKPVEKGK